MNQARRISSLVLIILLSTVPASARNFIGKRIPAFTIEDQFERTWTTRDFVGRPTVFVLSDREGYELSRNWTDKLVPRYKSQVRFVPVADVRSVPGFLKSFIRDKFQENFSYSVLMDWDGTLVTSFKMVEGQPNLILVDRDGIVTYATAGTGTPKQIDLFAKQLNAILVK